MQTMEDDVSLYGATLIAIQSQFEVRSLENAPLHVSIAHTPQRERRGLKRYI